MCYNFVALHAENEWFFNLLGIEENPIVCHLISFFSELITIFALLFAILYIVSLIQTFVSMKKIRFLSRKVNPVVAVLFMAAFGFIAPTCVCTAIPIVIGMITLGIPVYAAMTFLLSSSLINVSSLIMMFGVMGGKFTLTYIFVSMISTVITGILLVRIPITPLCDKEDFAIYDCKGMSFSQRLRAAYYNMLHSVDGVWIYVVIGVLIATLFEAFMPSEVYGFINNGGLTSLYIGEFLGLVIHADIIAMLPIAKTMVESGVSLIIIIGMIMSVAFYSLPTVFMLSNTVKRRDYLKVWGVFFATHSILLTFLYFMI